MLDIELHELLIFIGLLSFTSVYFIMKIIFSGSQEKEDRSNLVARIGFNRKRTTSKRVNHGDRWWSKIASYLVPTNPKELHEIHQRLIKAGKRDQQYIGGFYLFRLSLMIGVGLLGIVLWSLNIAPIYVALFGSLISYVIPERLLDYVGNQRQGKISQSLPDFLDMVNVGIGAGLSWLEAMKRVSEELKNLHPEICGEFAFLQEQIQIGMQRTHALRQLAERVPVKDIEQMVNILIQNEKLGSPIGEALATFSKRMYDEREEIMSEKAAKTSAKMALVIMPFLMVPYMILFIGEKMVMLGRGF